MNGLTLIELLLSIAILSIIAFVGTDILLFGYKSYLSTTSNTEMLNDGRNAIEQLIKALKNGRKATLLIHAGGESITFAADIDRNGTTETYTFYKNGDQFIRIKDTSITTTLAKNVVSVNFSTTSCVNIDFVLAKSNQRVNINTSVAMRN